MLTVHKPKLPRGKAYVLRTSLLEAVLPPDSVDCDMSLYYWTPQSGSSVLEAEFWLPNARRGATLFIRAGSLAAPEASAARAQLVDVVLPRFAAWARWLLELPAKAPRLQGKLRFVATYHGGSVAVTADGPE